MILEDTEKFSDLVVKINEVNLMNIDDLLTIMLLRSITMECEPRINVYIHTGFVFFLSGGPTSWKSGKQNGVTLSSTEAEYIKLSSAVKEAQHLSC